jgi:hypothetical protein
MSHRNKDCPIRHSETYPRDLVDLGMSEVRFYVYYELFVIGDVLYCFSKLFSCTDDKGGRPKPTPR